MLLRAVISGHLSLGDLRRWFEAHIGDLLPVCIFAGFVVWALARPSNIVGWVQKSHPEVPPEGWRWTPLIVRPLGALLIVFAALILVSILRHP